MTSPDPYDRPVHLQVMVVMASGEVVSLEMPTHPQDEAEFTLSTDSTLEGSAILHSRREAERTVTFTAQVRYRSPLDRPEGLCRKSTFGGVAPKGEIPGREVPDHVVAMLSQTLASWSPGMVRPGSLEYARAVRAQATLTGQVIWQQAWFSGLQYADQMGMMRQRHIVSDVTAAPPGPFG